MNNFSENLRNIRKENNLSQEQLADQLGVSRQAISKWESASAYPEMDKIIALCDKFNLNIDDLLHKDIKEIKGEEESKKKLNDFINDFLKFITDTINLFSSMNFKSRIKCIAEQGTIIFVLSIISLFIYTILSSLFGSILSFLPEYIYIFMHGILKSVLITALVIVSIIIIIHIFKTRYLNYYKEIKKEKNEIMEENKILLNKEDKIIIRDSKHSEYNFLNMMFKFIIVTIKFFSLLFGLFIAFVLICLLGSFIVSFLMYKTGIFFIGLLITILSSSVIAIVILLLILNFVFNRKNDKKKMIWSFIISLITFGIGCGLIFIGTLSFDILYDNDTMLKTITKEYNMRDDLLIYQNDYYEIEYVESDNKNVKIDYQINKYCDLNDGLYGENNNEISVWSYCENPINIAREYIKNINNKKIIPINNNIEKITVYTTKENIEKIKDNWNNRLSQIEERRSHEKEIDELEIENKELKQEIEELKRQVEN